MVRPLALALCLVFAALPARAEWVTLALPTGGSIKADLEVPAGTGKAKHPAVIYLHDALVREVGYDEAADRGYDVAAFARAFADAGFVGLAPVLPKQKNSGDGDTAVDEGLAAVLAAADLLRARPDVDPERIAVAGFGEGATIALWALARMPDLATGVVMSPAAMSSGRDAAKTMSLTEFLDGDAVKAIRAPLLLTVGERQDRGTRRRADAVADKLIHSYKRFRYIHTYRGDERWFWRPRETVMKDVTGFLRERMR